MSRWLLPFSWVYGVGTFCRARAFAWGLLKSEAAGVPVVSVGNLTAGGTGKTPLVEFLTGLVLGKGMSVGVVSRGYGRRSQGVVVVSDGSRVWADAVTGGDEPVQIARRFPTAIVVVGERRVAAAREAVRLGAKVILLDDGFQHRYLKRDMDIVVVDARRSLVREPLLPAGLRREPVRELRRATLVALSKATDGEMTRMRKEEIRRVFSGPVMTFRYRWEQIVRAQDQVPVHLRDLHGFRGFAFSGIGDHEGFLSGLRAAGADLCGDRKFRDHHAYGRADIEAVVTDARRLGADMVWTTEKDLARLEVHEDVRSTLFGSFSVYVPRIGVEILEGKEQFHTLLDECLQKTTN